MVRRFADRHRLSREQKKKIAAATIGYNLLAAVLWAAATVYGRFVGWQDSQEFLYWISAYAVVAGSLAAAIAGWPEPEVIEKLEELADSS